MCAGTVVAIQPLMSQPRAIFPGATYLITRRTLRRHLLFRPDAAITELLVYSLAVSAHRFGIQVHALCCMSTHLHLVVTDQRGVLPLFLQFFHRILALGTKVLRAWEGPVWDHEQTSVVRLRTRAALIEKMAYVLANPVAAGLVRRARQWPGAKGCAGGAELRAKRPSVYFDPKNPDWPPKATLLFTVPPAVEPARAEAFCRDVAAELEQQEARALAEARRQGHQIIGPERVCKVSPYDRATSFERLRACNPTFAVGLNQGTAWKRAAAAVRSFRFSYRRALQQWSAGLREVVFPTGTWWMRVFHGAATSEAALML